MDNNIDTIRVPTLEGNPRLREQMMSTMAPIDSRDMLTEKEELFCQLFCNGGKKYAGNAEECCRKVFDVRDKEKLMLRADRIMSSPAVVARLNSMMADKLEQEKFAKLRVLETLYAVMDETRESVYRNRWGQEISPAPLRAVSVNAAKAIADIMGFTNDSKSGVTIQGENNVTFNVIVPQKNA